MSDSYNIIVKCNGDQVCLYSHNGANEGEKILKTALERGQKRWDDYPYLVRIIFSEMIRDWVNENTGFGITSEVEISGPYDFIVDVDNQTVKQGKKKASFEKFIHSGFFDPSIVGMTVDLGGATYYDSPTLHKAVFDYLMTEYFIKHNLFCGESVMQTDKGIEGAVEVLADIADEVIQFNMKDDENGFDG